MVNGKEFHQDIQAGQIAVQFMKRLCIKRVAHQDHQLLLGDGIPQVF